MRDLFLEKKVSPMLIARMEEAFDASEWIYELKLDGCRCVAYLEPQGVTLRNKRNMELLPRFPELSEIHSNVIQRCVLDGELVVMVQGVPDFYELQKRTLMTNTANIGFAAGRLAASFVAYDCLQVGNRVLFGLPLMERKQALEQVLREGERISYSRYVHEKGREFFQLTVDKQLEGVVAKHRDSLYYPGKRSKDWVKFKRMADKEFVICGYEAASMPSLVLGEYLEGELCYAGTVTMGVRRELLSLLVQDSCPFSTPPPGKDHAVWCKPEYQCTVEYMPNTRNVLRQPVFKGIRDDV